MMPTKRHVLFLLTLLAAALTPMVDGHARTWSVDRSGAGDFTTIQPALDICSPGDTVQIGPGEYTESQFVTLPGWGFAVETYAYVEHEDITLLGAGSGQTVIGPPEHIIEAFTPHVITSNLDAAGLTVRHLTARNAFDGIYHNVGKLTVLDCSFKACGNGISISAGSNISIRQSEFELCTSIAILMTSHTGAALISDCNITNAIGAAGFSIGETNDWPATIGFPQPVASLEDVTMLLHRLTGPTAAASAIS